MYECCRLATLLYVNTVIRPALSGSRGLNVPVELLRQNLEKVDLLQLPDHASTAVAWALVIGALGSHRSEGLAILCLP